MRSLFTLLLVLALLAPIEVEAAAVSSTPTAQEGQGQPTLLAQRRRRRRRRRKPRRKKRRRNKKKAVKKPVKPVKKAEPKPEPVVAGKPALPVAVLADLSIPADLQERWAEPLAQGFVKGLLEAKEVQLLTGEPLKLKLGAGASSAVVTEQDLESLRQKSEAAVAYWIRLEPIKDRVRLTAVRTTPKVAIAFTRLLGPQVPEGTWFQEAAQALVSAADDQGFPATPAPAVAQDTPEVTEEEGAVRSAGPGSGLMVAGMGLLTAGFGMSLEGDASRMEASDNAADDSMQSSIADSRRVSERLVLGGYTLAGLGLAGALWTLVSPH